MPARFMRTFEREGYGLVTLTVGSVHDRLQQRSSSIAQTPTESSCGRCSGDLDPSG